MADPLMQFMPPPGRPLLYVLIGIPGCGKTTWAKCILTSAARISTDEIREELHPGIAYVAERNPEVFERYYGYIDEMLDYNYDVVADATNLLAASRRQLLEIAIKRNAEVHYIIFTNIEQAAERNRKRGEGRAGDATVPEDDQGMLKFASQYEQMLQDIRSEIHASMTFISEIW